MTDRERRRRASSAPPLRVAVSDAFVGVLGSAERLGGHGRIRRETAPHAPSDWRARERPGHAYAESAACAVAPASCRHAVVGAGRPSSARPASGCRRARAQRRQSKREYGEAVIEVLAEAPALDGRPQISWSRSGSRRRSARRGVLPSRRTVRSSSTLRNFAWRPSDRRPPRRERSFPGGRLKQARLSPAARREGSALESRTSRTRAGFRNCGAVDVDERAVRARPRAVE